MSKVSSPKSELKGMRAAEGVEEQEGLGEAFSLGGIPSGICA